MSCGGNRFQCGIGRFNKFTVPDKPSNQELHNETQKKLSELMQLREQQDKGNFSFYTQPLTLSNTDNTATTATTNNIPNYFTPFSYSYTN